MFKKIISSLETLASNTKEKDFSELVPDFLIYAQYDLELSGETIQKYRHSLRVFTLTVGDFPVEQLTLDHFTSLKERLRRRGVSNVYAASIVYAVKSFLKYCGEIKRLKCPNPAEIKVPKRKRREVIFLTTEEVERFISVINTNTKEGLRFRAIVETLLGTGARISEALAINRADINFETAEVKVIGKGNKERTLFFSERSLVWVKKYLEARRDKLEPLFITFNTAGKPRRLRRDDMWRYFKAHRIKSGINKKLTPHILRHTVATNLLFNGCPIGHIKEILGHDRLDTTCRYYLGVDKQQAKKAHGQYLSFD